MRLWFQLLFFIHSFLIDTTNIKHISLKESNITSGNLTLHYLVREPKTKTSKNKAIILLHGVGSNEQDLFNLGEHLSAESFIISARGPFSVGSGRFAWYFEDYF